MSTENNFWNTCPRKLDYRPDRPCHHECDWIINSETNNNCFWTYVANNSREDGTMKPLQASEIAKLLGITTGVASEYIEEAEAEMRLILVKKDIKSEINTELENIETIIMPEEELEDQDAFDIIIEDI